MACGPPDRLPSHRVWPHPAKAVLPTQPRPSAWGPHGLSLPSLTAQQESRGPFLSNLRGKTVLTTREP